MSLDHKDMTNSIKKLNDHDLLVAAFTAKQTNQVILAIKHFKEALRRDPGDPFAYIEIAKCYFNVNEPDQALVNVEKAFQFARRDPEILIQVANTCQSIRNYHLAIKVLEEAEDVPQLKHVALVRQAEVYELSNQLDNAERVLKKINGVETQASRAIRAKLYRRRGNYCQARILLEDLIKDTGENNPTFTSSLQYELATILDKTGDYKNAANTLEKAKSYHIGTDAYKLAERGRQGIIHTLSGLCTNIDEATIKQWKIPAEVASASHKQSFLLGHPRSGTTLIEQALDAHPHVISADETPIFHNAIWMPTALKNSKIGSNLSDHLNDLTKNSLRKARRDYQLRWDHSISSQQSKKNTLQLDKNPALTTRLALIARFFPDASLVFALRDPRDVVISSYMQPVGLNDWSINWLTLKETVDYYCFTMQMWIDIRQKLENSWIEVRYEDCVSNFESQARLVTKHLGLDWHASQEDVQKHVSKKVIFSPTYADAGKAVYSSSVGRWKNYKELLDPHMDKLIPYIEEFGYTLD